MRANGQGGTSTSYFVCAKHSWKASSNLVGRFQSPLTTEPSVPASQSPKLYFNAGDVELPRPVRNLRNLFDTGICPRVLSAQVHALSGPICPRTLRGHALVKKRIAC